MSLIALIAYAVIGIGAGILSGLLGISGGIVTVPCLLLVFHLLNFSHGALMHLAIGTSLAAMVFSAISATYAHHQAKQVDWSLFKTMMPGVVLGCLVGAWVGYELPGAILEVIFGFFAIVIGIHFYRLHMRKEPKHYPFPEKNMLNGTGFGVGALANMLGIGGGTLLVPAFMYFKITMKMAVGTAAAVGFVVSLIGALAYLFFGRGEVYYEHTVGYVYLPAFVVLSITTFLAAPFGARWAHRMASNKLLRIFALSLIALGVFMMLRWVK